MTVTYPLSLPSTPAARNTRFALRSAAAVGSSPFTYKQQTHSFPGQMWEVEVQLPPMLRATVADWQGWLLSLRGRYGTFLLGDWDATTPRGTATGTPVADSAGSPTINAARDRVFHTTGWTTGVTGIMKAGDYLQIGTGLSSHLHMVVADANSDGSGNAALDIEPALREDVTNGLTITTSSAKGLFRLASNDIGWESNHASVYGFTFACTEVL